ncbi:Serine/threonine-protein phosphatase PP1 isozyme 1 [Sarcoptes scabiei]|uniref:Serine/threonine protein phosphatase-like protein 3 n=1 Tax=Sarcoptes scabiei TaxID=52283 RepID=A0A132A268_SARSC|nr:Serine/threonine-protein phosphatase PP1 isozyme 1 [Sarcoptes scabiei]KPM05138.1 serine/threonine protein phosphatase-like protein 3 [Sarcoptes scabiei]
MSLNLSKSDSEISIGFGATPSPPSNDYRFQQDGPKFKTFTNSKLEPENCPPIDEYLYNCIVFVIYCPKHQKVALSLNERSRAVWLPFIASSSSLTWSDATSQGLPIILNRDDGDVEAQMITPVPIKSINCLHVLRIQLPITKKFIYRLIQLIILDDRSDATPASNAADRFECCQSTKRLQWIDSQDAIDGNIAGIWGPEIPKFVSLIQGKRTQELYEYGLEQAYCYLPKNLANAETSEEQMLLSLEITEKEIEQIYADFLEHCFPSFYMTYWSFCSYFSDYIHHYEKPETALKLFNAFNYNNNGYLGFHEFLLGLLSIEPNCPNNEARLKFVFRFYDQNKDDLIDKEELLQMLNDLNIFNAQNLLKNLELPLEYINFIQFVQEKNLPTEILCRSSSPIFVNICLNYQRRFETRLSSITKNFFDAKQRRKKDANCLGCQDRTYEFGLHCVRLDDHGKCVEPRHILEKEEIQQSTPSVSDGISISKYSQEYVFSTVSIGNTFLDLIREINSNRKDKIGLFQNGENTDVFIKLVKILCQNVLNILENEPRLIKINSSGFVFGDLNGNLDNLLRLERALWQSIPVVPCNYVFLGNYVEGELMTQLYQANSQSSNSFETILYLFSMKIVAPNKFFLLRGRNEMRTSPRNRFQMECIKKYGTQNGNLLYDSINDVFDRMPLALIIDEQVFCSNCGLSNALKVPREIFKLPSVLKNPLQNLISAGLLSNTESNDQYLKQFLDRNNLSFVIRSNRTINDPLSNRGYKFNLNGQVITLVNNVEFIQKEINVVLVDHPKIQMIKIDLTGK